GTGLAVCAEGTRVPAASRTDQKLVCLWDAKTGEEVLRFQGHTGAVGTVALWPDGRHALSGSLAGEMVLWDANTGKKIRRFVGHTHYVSRVAFSPDGQKALSTGPDNTIRVWEVATGKQLDCFGPAAN